jgi:4-hydroxy-4-methyl-2-oxoglutarate aldolase
VVVGRISIAPGDLVVGDRDGVVVVPRAEVELVATRLDAVRSAESIFEDEALKGLRVPDFMRSLLQSDKVRYVD